MSYPIRTISADDLPAYERAISLAFNSGELLEEGPDRDAAYAALELDRCFAAFDGGAIVGTAAAYSREVGVPGGLAPVAAVSDVTAARDHRRRGVVSSLMAAQLDQVAAREGLAMLWASEAQIYPRFGYGCAGQRLEHVISRASAGFSSAGTSLLAAFDGTLAEGRPAEFICEISSVVGALAPGRPGLMPRPELQVRRSVIDPPSQRGGVSEQRLVLARAADGSPAGFARFAIRPGRARGLAGATVVVREAQALTSPAQAALWHYLLAMDLTTGAEVHFRPNPDVLTLLLADHRQLRPSVMDSVYVRVVDPVKALQARAFASYVDVVVELADAFRPGSSGRFRISVKGPDEYAEVTPTREEADLRIPVSELGAAYLGARRLSDLAALGGIAEFTPGALLATSRAFAWDVPLSASEMF